MQYIIRLYVSQCSRLVRWRDVTRTRVVSLLRPATDNSVRACVFRSDEGWKTSAAATGGLVRGGVTTTISRTSPNSLTGPAAGTRRVTAAANGRAVYLWCFPRWIPFPVCRSLRTIGVVVSGARVFGGKQSNRSGRGDVSGPTGRRCAWDESVSPRIIGFERVSVNLLKVANNRSSSWKLGEKISKHWSRRSDILSV